MKFYISTENSSGCKYHTKEDFLKEISFMIDDCIANGGTYFDWDANHRLCEFYIFHKNGIGFIKVFVNANNTVDAYIYENGEMSPTSEFKEELRLDAYDFMNLMWTIADSQDLWDKPIDELDWDLDIE